MTKTAEPSPPPSKTTAAVEAPPLAPGAVPLCYVVDEEPSLRHFLSLVLHGVGVDTVECADGDAMRKALDDPACPISCSTTSRLNRPTRSNSMLALGKRGFRGAVQLMSNRGAAVLDHVKTVGLQHKLNMLPVLKKPFETDAIVKILHELKLGLPPAVATRLDLAGSARQQLDRVLVSAENRSAQETPRRRRSLCPRPSPAARHRAARRLPAGRERGEPAQIIGTGADQRAQGGGEFRQARRASDALGQYPAGAACKACRWKIWSRRIARRATNGRA